MIDYKSINLSYNSNQANVFERVWITFKVIFRPLDVMTSRSHLFFVIIVHMFY